ncbi:hypothetical protein CEXT_319261, partial [Caerostris extrusa]
VHELLTRNRTECQNRSSVVPELQSQAEEASTKAAAAVATAEPEAGGGGTAEQGVQPGPLQSWKGRKEVGRPESRGSRRILPSPFRLSVGDSDPSQYPLPPVPYASHTQKASTTRPPTRTQYAKSDIQHGQREQPGRPGGGADQPGPDAQHRGRRAHLPPPPSTPSTNSTPCRRPTSVPTSASASGPRTKLLRSSHRVHKDCVNINRRKETVASSEVVRKVPPHQ